MLKQKAIADHYTFLGFKDKTIKDLIETDKESKILFREGKKKIPKCSKIRHRIELMKLSEYIYGIFVLKLINRLKVVIDIKTKAIRDYWLNCYEPLMEELDKLLWKPSCDCRNIGFGFCFCN